MGGVTFLISLALNRELLATGLESLLISMCLPIVVIECTYDVYNRENEALFQHTLNPSGVA